MLKVVILVGAALTNSNDLLAVAANSLSILDRTIIKWDLPVPALLLMFTYSSLGGL
jgi:hypothetical protein